MPIYDNDGTTSYEIGKIYDNDGTTNYQIGKVYDNDGTTSYLIYTAEITVTNLLPKDSISWSWSDWGYDAPSSNGAVITMDPAKRYFWRHHTWVSQYNVNASADYYSWVQGGLAGISTPSAYHSLDTTPSGITTGKASTRLTASMRRQYTCGSAGVNNGMLVDITELESVYGTLTAAQVWQILGSAHFTGSKTIEV